MNQPELAYCEQLMARQAKFLDDLIIRGYTMDELSEATLTAIKTAKQSRAAAIEANSLHDASVEKLNLTTQEEAEKKLNVTKCSEKAIEDAKAAVAALQAELGL